MGRKTTRSSGLIASRKKVRTMRPKSKTSKHPTAISFYPQDSKYLMAQIERESFTAQIHG